MEVEVTLHITHQLSNPLIPLETSKLLRGQLTHCHMCAHVIVCTKILCTMSCMYPAFIYLHMYIQVHVAIDTQNKYVCTTEAIDIKSKGNAE